MPRMLSSLAFVLLLQPLARAQAWAPLHYLNSRYDATLVTDTGRDRLVLFGGFGAGRHNDVWEWDGEHWAAQTPGWSTANRPRGRQEHAAAYDANRGVVVVFGGRSDWGVEEDTWEWDGVTWRQPNTTSQPSLRQNHAMAYDPVRGETVMFGGRSESLAPVYYADTWTWDGNAWTDVTQAGGPPARGEFSMVWHPGRQRVVLFGGTDSKFPRTSGTVFGDLWEWDGSAWSQIVGTQPPTARYRYTMAYDASLGGVVLVGGFDANGNWLSDVWLWSGATWRLVQPSSPPAERWGPALAYDPAGRQLLLFGGKPTTGGSLADTWAFDGSRWTELDGGPPSERDHASMAYDATRQRTVMFGGLESGTRPQRDTWEWDGIRWTQARPATAPRWRFRHSSTYDSARRRTLVFGGQLFTSTSTSSTPFANDLWEWDGQTWREATAELRPSPRHGAAMAFDAARGRAVLFGGDVGMGPGANNLLGDTWEWDGTRWIEQRPATAPPARRRAAMAYDPVRQRVVLFGGHTAASNVADDTWEWDGVDWRPLSPATKPPGRRQHVMAYDAERGVVIAYGGSAGLSPLTDLWEWDGVTWTLVPINWPAFRPFKGKHAGAWDGAAGTLVVFGGDIDPTNPHATWRYSGLAPQAATVFTGTGCGGAGGAPQLRAWGRPATGTPFALDVLNGPANALGVLMLATTVANRELGGGCSLYVQPTSVVVHWPLAPNNIGFASLPVPLPTTPWALGLQFYAQGAVLDPGGPFAGLSFTDGLRVTVGL